MRRFIESDSRKQGTLFPEYLEDYVTEDNPVRVVDVFVEHLDLGKLGFNRAEPAITGRPSYHPSALLKLYIYGYLNRIQSSRRLEKETQRNVELMWLLGRLSPDFKTIALTEPYMHDGSMETLEEVIDHFDKGGDKNRFINTNIFSLQLTKQEKADLVEFMRSLTSLPL